MKLDNKTKGIGFIVAGFLLTFVLTNFVYSQFLYMLFRILGVVALGTGAFMLLKFRSAEKKENAKQKTLDLKSDVSYQDGDEAMSAEIRRLQSDVSKYKLMLGAAVVIGILALAAGGFLGVVVLLAASIPSALLLNGAQSKLKNFIADNIVRQALEDVFDDINYEPGNHISDSYIHNCHMGLPHFDYIRGSDFVKGKYKGLNIEMSDITLIVEDVTTDEEGNEQRDERPVFQGLWLVCDFGKELSADMRIWEKGRSIFRDKGIKTENEQFNKKFHIESVIEHEAFYILTPHMMEYILEMDRKANGVTRMCFARGGKVQITIDSGRDAFEVGKGEVDATALRKKFVREIRYVTDIIDELRLVDTLYKK